MHPWTDWFGTRLAPNAVLNGLGQTGLTPAHLVIEDDGVTLVVRPDTNPTTVGRGLVWLREQLSPLTSVTVRASDDVETGLTDTRTHHPDTLVLAESWSEGDLRARLEDLADRLGSVTDATGEMPWPDGPVGGVLGDVLKARGWTPGSVGAVAWTRPGSEPEGVRQATIVAASTSLHTLQWLRQALADPVAAPRDANILLDGLTWGAARRPTIAIPRALAPEPTSRPEGGKRAALTMAPKPTSRPEGGKRAAPTTIPIWTDPARCTECGLCEAMCPTDFLDASGRPRIAEEPKPTSSVARDRGQGRRPPQPTCISCYECVDACPADAIRPVSGPDAFTHSRVLEHRGPWLSRLRGGPGPLQPPPFPPSYLLPRSSTEGGAPQDALPGRVNAQGKGRRQPQFTLGLAILTMAEHAAVLLRNGELVGAVEEEKLVRVRHFGRRLPGRPGFGTPAVDPTLLIEEALCHRSVAALLGEAGITLDDLDTIAVNGLHGRYRHAFSHLTDDEPLPVLTSGRLVSVPHHLCHAASAYRVAGVEDAWIFTVDGRGDRETAAVFRAEGGQIRDVATLLSLDDQSVGGVYQTVTEELGFGSFGQGSLMALAGFGEPTVDLSQHLSATSAEDYSVHEAGLREASRDCRRGYDDPIEARHHDLAASIQAALEAFALAVVGSSVSEPPIDALCLAGGVTLNCHMNRELKDALQPARMFVQPAANDGGTALGAAAEAWALGHDGQNLAEMTHAQWGPAFDDQAIERALRRSGLAYSRPDDVAQATALRLAGSRQIVAWFQGRLEFGPRALGGRCLIADPRDPATSDRLNRLKQRQAWRPFAPSILAGHEAEWFEGGFDSRFMLFTLPVAEDKRELVPAIVHVDGTSRPQVVHPETHPVYHQMITAFHALTGVPLVVDTSFNRRGEPIVHSPEDALDAFVELGADAMAIGPFLVEHPSRVAPPGLTLPTDAEVDQLPITRHAPASRLKDGKRTAPVAIPATIRLTPSCNLGCPACPVTDAEGPVATRDDLDARLVEAREDGAGELVLVAGDSEISGGAVAHAVGRARALGFQAVTLRTHGGALARPGTLSELRSAGLGDVELVVLAVSPKVHDALCPTPGAMAGVGAALQAVAAAGDLRVVVPLLRGVLPRLRKVLDKVATMAPESTLVLRYPDLVLTPDGMVTEPLVPMEAAAASVAQALAAVAVGRVEIEGLSTCALPAVLHPHLATHAPAHAPATPCRGCALVAGCATPSPRYQAARGTGALTPVATAP
jgi:predicted NodU family carbamoyl transferase/ferredoxin